MCVCVLIDGFYLSHLSEIKKMVTVRSVHYNWQMYVYTKETEKEINAMPNYITIKINTFRAIEKNVDLHTATKSAK